jgi:hypothetical protein
MGMYDYRPYVKKVTNNKQILFECERGWHLDNGPPGATCVDGQWSPQNLPRCIRGSHPKMRWLRSVGNAVRRRKWSTHQSKDFFQIHEKKSRGRRHQKLKGINILNTLHWGLISRYFLHSKAPCEPLKDTPWMKISIIKFGIGNDSFPHGSRVKVFCSNGYVSNIGNLTAKCAKGNWKPHKPDCLIGIKFKWSIYMK